MSNLILSVSLTYLAHEEVGCIDEDLAVQEDCDEKIYGIHGFDPAILNAIIAFLSGLLAAFCMPVIGAVVDFTPHRKMVGIVSVVCIVIIQTIQIGTVSSTWFIMSLLQIIAAFLYQALVLAAYAFMPDIFREVGEKNMSRFTATWTASQFAAQAAFGVVVGVVAGIIFWKYDVSQQDVVTAQISQAINVVSSVCLFTLGWKKFPAVPRNRELPPGHSILTEGFKQNWKTIKCLAQTNSRKTLLYFLAVVFAEAGTNTFTTVSSIYLQIELGLSSQQITIFFLITMICTIPGAYLGDWVTCKTNPNVSYRISMLFLVASGNIGGFLLDGVQTKELSFLWAACVGFILGWFYPCETLYFSMVVPKSQEAELAGFFVYCSQILGWLPPLIFSIIVGSGIKQKWGILSVSGFHLVAIGILCLPRSWEDVGEKPIFEEDMTNEKNNRKNVEVEAPSFGSNATFNV